MDRILVFNKGNIVEDGTHNELIRKDSYYKNYGQCKREDFYNYHRFHSALKR